MHQDEILEPHSHVSAFLYVSRVFNWLHVFKYHQIFSRFYINVRKKNTKSECWSSFLWDMRRNQWIPAVFVSFSSPLACFQDLKQAECGEIKTAKPQTFLYLLRGGCESVEELVWRLICFSQCGFQFLTHVFLSTTPLACMCSRKRSAWTHQSTRCTQLIGPGTLLEKMRLIVQKKISTMMQFLSLWHSGNITDLVILLRTPGAPSCEGK